MDIRGWGFLEGIEVFLSVEDSGQQEPPCPVHSTILHALIVAFKINN